MEGVQLKATKEERDLGVYLQSDLKPSKQCIESVKKANRALGLIRRNIENKSQAIVCIGCINNS